jgi:hypothetical protein
MGTIEHEYNRACTVITRIKDRMLMAVGCTSCSGYVICNDVLVSRIRLLVRRAGGRVWTFSSLSIPCHSTSLSTTTPMPTLEEHPTLIQHSPHRQNIARIVSSLRPVRPHTPFYRLAAHRVPTLWVLYRGLLRASPSPIVRSNANS